MNVLFLTHSFPRREGDAAGSFILRLAVALKSEDVNVHVVAPAGPGLPASEEIEGVPVDRFRYAPRRFEQLAYTGNMAGDVASSWTAKFALVGFLGADFVHAVRARRTFEPQVVHAHWWFPSGVVGTWVGGLSHVPLVTTLHGTDVRLARSVGVAKPLFGHVLKHSAAVTTVSSWLRDKTQELAPEVNPIVAPMPVSTDLFFPGGSRDGQRLLFVGRLMPQKGLDHLLHAMAAMKTQPSLDVVGDGPSRQALETLSQELGVASRVRWHGQVSQSELPRLYQNASAVVVPSTEEGLGLVAVEALLCETPVVAFDSGGLRDVIQHNRTGLLVPPGDRIALARTLDDLLGRNGRGGDLGRAGRLYALSAFAPESAARRYADIYQQVIGANAS
ncbi:MAG: glycosyl transferase group 1 [Gemmatimonadales bacterium]|jgi:glycosyltransferase involved in cell wall biosynthesis|nr:glycosyl transferase group 1 [Gemmatimonadales bacterium]